MSSHHRITLGVCTALAAAAAAVSPARAQQPSGVLTLEEIVVTARKVEENINQVPVAISAFSADEIARRNIEGLGDVAKYTAGFSFENFPGGSTPAPVIRGLSQNVLTDRNQNVATFVDGVHVQQQGNIDFNLLDVERIEVLKGPQNSQYGRSAFAGAINYVSKKPVLGKLEGEVAATIGSDERYAGRAGVSLPFWGDKLALRLYAVRDEFDGTWENRFPGGDRGVSVREPLFGKRFQGTDGNTGGYDNQAGQVQLRFAPVEGLMIDLGYFKSEASYEQGAIQFVTPSSLAAGLQYGTNCSNNLFYCGELKVNDQTVSVDPRSVGLYAETELKQATVSWEIRDNLSVTYQFGRNDLDQNTFSHATNPPNPAREGCGFFSGPPVCAPGSPGGSLLFQTGPTFQKATSHELRFDGQALGGAARWRVGYYNSDVEDQSRVNSVEGYRSLLFDTAGQTSVYAFGAVANRFEDKTDAFFASGSYSFSEVWSVDVEGRYSKEERANPTGTIRTPKTFNDFTPRVNVKAQMTPELMFYFSAAKGSKSGGFNTATADPGFETFAEETNWTYELGGKNTLLDGRLQLNYDVFFIDWTDLQISSPDQLPTTPGGTDSNYVTNAAGAQSIGVELEAVILLTDHWQANFAGSYAQAEFDSGLNDFSTAGGVVFGTAFPKCDNVVCRVVTETRAGGGVAFGSPIGGNQLPRSPKAKVAAGLEYANKLGEWEYRLRGDVSYQDKQYLEVLNLGYTPGRTLLDLNVTATSPSGDLSLSLWGKNVTDESYVSNSFYIGFSNAYAPSLGQGATFGLTGRYRFGD